MRNAILGLILTVAVATPASAAVVGTLNFAGDSITAPVAFTNQFNSTAEVDNGLQFAIAPGLSGPVKLDLIASTPNVTIAAAAIDGNLAFGPVPLSVLSDPLNSGLHRFAIAAISKGAAVLGYKLTLTPVPAALPMLAMGLAGLVMLRRRV